MLFYKRLLPDYLQMLSLRKLKIVSLQMLKFGLRLPLLFYGEQFNSAQAQRLAYSPAFKWGFCQCLRHGGFC